MLLVYWQRRLIKLSCRRAILLLGRHW